MEEIPAIHFKKGFNPGQKSLNVIEEYSNSMFQKSKEDSQESFFGKVALDLMAEMTEFYAFST